MMTSVGKYKQVSDVVSDLNVMIVEAPVDNKFKRRLADIVYDIEREETLKNTYQFLTEVSHGMYKVNILDEYSGSELNDVIQESDDVRSQLERYFTQEISPVESD